MNDSNKRVISSSEKRRAWEAFMKMEPMNCIIEPRCYGGGGGIYLGNIEAAKDIEGLRKNGIGAVLTVAARAKIVYPVGSPVRSHVTIDADDVVTFNLLRYFHEIIAFIDNNSASTNVLVHCFAGVSRSATAVIAYLMKNNGWTFKQAFNHTKVKRNVVNPNYGFVRQLLTFEDQLLIIDRIISKELSGSNSNIKLAQASSFTSSSKAISISSNNKEYQINNQKSNERQNNSSEMDGLRKNSDPLVVKVKRHEPSFGSPHESSKQRISLKVGHPGIKQYLSSPTINIADNIKPQTFSERMINNNNIIRENYSDIRRILINNESESRATALSTLFPLRDSALGISCATTPIATSSASSKYTSIANKKQDIRQSFEELDNGYQLNGITRRLSMPDQQAYSQIIASKLPSSEISLGYLQNHMASKNEYPRQHQLSSPKFQGSEDTRSSFKRKVPDEVLRQKQAQFIDITPLTPHNTYVEGGNTSNKNSHVKQTNSILKQYSVTCFQSKQQKSERVPAEYKEKSNSQQASLSSARSIDRKPPKLSKQQSPIQKKLAQNMPTSQLFLRYIAKSEIADETSPTTVQPVVTFNLEDNQRDNYQSLQAYNNITNSRRDCDFQSRPRASSAATSSQLSSYHGLLTILNKQVQTLNPPPQQKPAILITTRQTNENKSSNDLNSKNNYNNTEVRQSIDEKIKRGFMQRSSSATISLASKSNIQLPQPPTSGRDRIIPAESKHSIQNNKMYPYFSVTTTHKPSISSRSREYDKNKSSPKRANNIQYNSPLIDVKKTPRYYPTGRAQFTHQHPLFGDL